MRLSTKQIGIILIVVVVLGGGWILIQSNLRSGSTPPPVTLMVWGIGDQSGFDGVFQKYRTLRPNVTIQYENVAAAGYEEKVVNALAAGRGPDVLMISNRALPRMKDKLSPVPAAQFGIAQLRDIFPRVIEQDFVSGSDIYALPLYIDTLALFYNKDMFDTAGIVGPPPTWAEFQNIIPSLRSLTENRAIERAGAAIGGSMATVPHAVDILHLLMLQNGTAMTTPDGGGASFSSDNGVRAMNFYLQFVDGSSPYYTWNESQRPAFESFLGGTTAMVFGYDEDLATLKKKSPFLSIGMAPVPQTRSAAEGGTALTYADYRGFAVSKQSKVPEWGWDFTVFATTDAAASESYTKAVKRPPALRTAIAKAINDPDKGVFAKQALTARSWYIADEARVEKIFDNAIRAVLTGQADTARALRQASDQVSELMRPSF